MTAPLPAGQHFAVPVVRLGLGAWGKNGIKIFSLSGVDVGVAAGVDVGVAVGPLGSMLSLSSASMHRSMLISSASVHSHQGE